MIPGPLFGPIEPTGPTQRTDSTRPAPGQKTGKSGGFDQVLAREVARGGTSTEPTSPLREVPRAVQVSAHAQQRLLQQGIPLEQDWLAKVGAAIDRAQAKGSRDTLIVSGNVGLIVNVHNRTVVTAIDRERMVEGMITGIDSTLFLDPLQ